MSMFSSFRRLLEYGTLQDHIEEILAKYDEETKPGIQGLFHNKGTLPAQDFLRKSLTRFG